MATTSPSPGGVNTNNYRFSGAGVSVFILGRVLCIFGHRIASQRSSAFGRSHSNDGNNRAQKAAQSGPNGIVAANRSRTVQFSSVVTNINIVILLPVDGYLWLPVWASSSSKDAQAWSEKRKTNIIKIMMHLLDLFENDAILVLSIKYMRIQLNNKSGVWQQKNQIDQDWRRIEHLSDKRVNININIDQIIN